MNVAVGGRASAPPFLGLEQFNRRGGAGDVGYCIAGARPYALEFHNDDDVICLLLGDIASAAKFEDDREQPLVFEGQSAAFHPRGGNVRVRANEVRQGFIAFSYEPSFQASFDDVDLGRVRRAGSRNNIGRRSIRRLARYALGRLRSGEGLHSFEIQSLATHVYLETMRSLEPRAEAPRHGLSDREFAAICAFVDAELGNAITCAGMAAAANVPTRVVFDGMRQRIGMSPYRLVMEKRIERACTLLTASDIPIAEVALLCGFSSQQHLTSTLSRKRGKTPQRIRLHL